METAGPGTDLAAVWAGYASVTPVSIDRTDDAFLAALREELEATRQS